MKKYNRFLIRHALLPLLALLFVSVPAVQASVDEIRADYKDASAGTVLVVAHRGAHNNHPECSLPSIHAAIEMGVDIVEIDIRQTKDGHLVIIHDATVDRTTDGSGRVDEMTFEEIRQLRLRMTDGTLTDEIVPTLEEALLAVKGRALINLDMKVQTILPETAAVVKATGTGDHVLLKCYRPPLEVAEAYAYFPEGLLYMPLISDRRSRRRDSPEAAVSRFHEIIEVLRPDAIEIVFDYEETPLISPELRKIADKNGVRLWANSLWASLAAGRVDSEALIDPDAHWGWLVENGISIIQTDEPEALLEYLHSRGWRR